MVVGRPEHYDITGTGLASIDQVCPTPAKGRPSELPREQVADQAREPSDGADVFVHISAVERAGLRSLNDGQKISYELVQDKRSGKTSADQLSVL
ncbi:cold shock protein [Phyllobacterium sp. YR531]|nr:cold shock protein [Phyllobacterium sp. YR531]